MTHVRRILTGALVVVGYGALVIYAPLPAFLVPLYVLLCWVVGAALEDLWDMYRGG